MCIQKTLEAVAYTLMSRPPFTERPALFFFFFVLKSIYSVSAFLGDASEWACFRHTLLVLNPRTVSSRCTQVFVKSGRSFCLRDKPPGAAGARPAPSSPACSPALSGPVFAGFLEYLFGGLNGPLRGGG